MAISPCLDFPSNLKSFGFSFLLPCLSLQSQGCLRVFAELHFNLRFTTVEKARWRNQGGRQGTGRSPSEMNPGSNILRRNPYVCGFQLPSGTWGTLQGQDSSQGWIQQQWVHQKHCFTQNVAQLHTQQGAFLNYILKVVFFFNYTLAESS